MKFPRFGPAWCAYFLIVGVFIWLMADKARHDRRRAKIVEVMREHISRTADSSLRPALLITSDRCVKANYPIHGGGGYRGRFGLGVSEYSPPVKFDPEGYLRCFNGSGEVLNLATLRSVLGSLIPR